MNKVRSADVIYLVLRAFVSPSVSSYDEKIDVVKDLEDIQQELILYVSTLRTVN